MGIYETLTVLIGIAMLTLQAVEMLREKKK